MTPPRGAPTEVNQDMILGEMRGQLREVVHSMNNLTQKFDALTREVIGLAVLSNEVSVLNSSVAAVAADVAALKAERNRREGAVGIIETFVKSPLLGWMVGAATLGLAIIKGWIQVQ